MFIAYNDYEMKKQICPHAQKQRPTWTVINRQV